MAEEEKTEQATPKRRQESRNKGDVARSQEVNTAFLLAFALLALWLSGGHIYDTLGEMARYLLSNSAQIKIDVASTGELVSLVMGGFLEAFAPFFGAVIIAGIVGNIVQIGFMWSFEPLQPKFDRLNPINGFKNLFKLGRKLVDLVKGVGKLVVLSWVAYLTVAGDLDILPFLSDVEMAVYLGYEMDLAFRIFKNVIMVYIIIAVIDWAIQKHRHEEAIKMTKQEVKDEFKQMEGDPTVKRRIRKLQYEAVRRRMMHKVPEADVVVTNPTHYAVALQYDPDEMEAPLVVAKGMNLIAKKIIEIAEQNDVVVYRNPEVARALHRTVEPGDSVPADMFQAVAEILAHVYRLKPGAA